MSRRLRAYRAEDRAAARVPLEPLDGTLAAAQSYVDRIVRSGWWERACPRREVARGVRLPVVGVDVEEGRHGGGHCRWEVRVVRSPRLGAVAAIRLGRGEVHGSTPAIADRWVILHELAHVLALADGHGGHGGPFAYHYRALVRRWVGPVAAGLLAEELRAEGLKLRRVAVKRLHIPAETLTVTVDAADRAAHDRL